MCKLYNIWSFFLFSLLAFSCLRVSYTRFIVCCYSSGMSIWLSWLIFSTCRLFSLSSRVSSHQIVSVVILCFFIFVIIFKEVTFFMYSSSCGRSFCCCFVVVSFAVSSALCVVVSVELCSLLFSIVLVCVLLGCLVCANSWFFCLHVRPCYRLFCLRVIHCRLVSCVMVVVFCDYCYRRLLLLLLMIFGLASKFCCGYWIWMIEKAGIISNAWRLDIWCFGSRVGWMGAFIDIISHCCLG